MIEKGESRGQDVSHLRQFLEEDRPEETLRTDSEIEDEMDMYRERLLDSRKNDTDPKTTVVSGEPRPEDIPIESIEKDQQSEDTKQDSTNKRAREESSDAEQGPSNKRAREESSDNGEGPSNKRVREDSSDNGEGPSNKKVK
jgi:hypothetical protein